MSESIAARQISTEECVCGSGPIPRGEKRRREIALVAEKVFFENGFADTTMQMIAMRAGASKETLYRHFGSKEGLFAEVVETRAKSFLDNLDENFDRPGSVAEVLRNMSHRMLQAMVGSEGISLCRIVVAEAPRNAEVGEIFYSRGPARVRDRLTAFLGAAVERGELLCKDPELAGQIFLGAVMAHYHLVQLVLRDPPSPSQAQLERHVDEVVDMFLLKYAH